MWRAFVLLLFAVPAAAHPLPTWQYDRTVEVRLTAAGVSVRYALEVNEWTMAVDRESKFSDAELAEIKAARPSQKMPQQIYAKKKARILADNMIATANGTSLSFRSEAAP